MATEKLLGVVPRQRCGCTCIFTCLTITYLFINCSFHLFCTVTALSDSHWLPLYVGLFIVINVADSADWPHVSGRKYVIYEIKQGPCKYILSLLSHCMSFLQGIYLFTFMLLSTRRFQKIREQHVFCETVQANCRFHHVPCLSYSHKRALGCGLSVYRQFRGMAGILEHSVYYEFRREHNNVRNDVLDGIHNKLNIDITQRDGFHQILEHGQMLKYAVRSDFCKWGVTSVDIH
jgi:hypothetical protein